MGVEKKVIDHTEKISNTIETLRPLNVNKEDFKLGIVDILYALNRHLDKIECLIENLEKIST